MPNAGWLKKRLAGKVDAERNANAAINSLFNAKPNPMRDLCIHHSVVSRR